MHNVCVCAERKLLLSRNYFTILIIYYYKPYHTHTYTEWRKYLRTIKTKMFTFR